MMNIDTSDAIVSKIKNAEWWQGSVVEDGTLRSVEPNLPEGFAYWIMASQTCNLYNNDFQKISKVEWIAANVVKQSTTACRGGRNPRLLETKASSSEGETWLICDTQERHWGRRENLALLAPCMALKNIPALGQSEQHKDNFSAWLARGYTRLELSDELNTALTKGKFMSAIDKLLTAHEADIFGIFIKVSDNNKNSPEHVKPPCDMDLRVVVSKEATLKDVRTKLAELFSTANIKVEKGEAKTSREKILAEDFSIILDQQALPALRWDATLIEQHLRFNFRDYLSGPEEDAME
ncbi:hypothetical protein CLU92_1808 [Janthinobacterium sp. 61]|uniref:hypothetical protein n=1 Tax=Janthinobacterium sp. 61 TaxID=2035209 RepID=UPI000CAE0EC9|nr:hypothetical protein [Janthinobacterium sp. 61]PKV44468.1 hypothetical protein CLU92_1808 [Janthinobacterium sp. 61]